MRRGPKGFISGTRPFFQRELDGGLNHPIPDRRDAQGTFPLPSFRIIPRQTGAVRYVFSPAVIQVSGALIPHSATR
jgi:hypothetical protein